MGGSGSREPCKVVKTHQLFIAKNIEGDEWVYDTCIRFKLGYGFGMKLYRGLSPLLKLHIIGLHDRITRKFESLDFTVGTVHEIEIIIGHNHNQDDMSKYWIETNISTHTSHGQLFSRNMNNNKFILSISGAIRRFQNEAQIIIPQDLILLIFNIMIDITPMTRNE